MNALFRESMRPHSHVLLAHERAPSAARHDGCIGADIQSSAQMEVSPSLKIETGVIVVIVVVVIFTPVHYE